jgi:hypothetical protein
MPKKFNIRPMQEIRQFVEKCFGFYLHLAPFILNFENQAINQNGNSNPTGKINNI